MNDRPIVTGEIALGLFDKCVKQRANRLLGEMIRDLTFLTFLTSLTSSQALQPLLMYLNM